jgi:hypothetical protein
MPSRLRYTGPHRGRVARLARLHRPTEPVTDKAGLRLDEFRYQGLGMVGPPIRRLLRRLSMTSRATVSQARIGGTLMLFRAVRNAPAQGQFVVSADAAGGLSAPAGPGW